MALRTASVPLGKMDSLCGSAGGEEESKWCFLSGCRGGVPILALEVASSSGLRRVGGRA